MMMLAERLDRQNTTVSDSRRHHLLGIVLLGVAALAGFGASRVWPAEKEERTAIPGDFGEARLSQAV